MARKVWKKTAKTKRRMEHPEAPSGFVTLYNYKEPFMKFPNGFGYQGVLLMDEATDKVQCHYCGGWFEYLSHHLHREHNMTAAEYKQAVGLRKNTALIGERFRAKLIAVHLDVRKSNLRVQWGPKSEEQKQKIRETLKKNADIREQQNESGTCPLQLVTRLQKLTEKLGRTPKHEEITFQETLRRVFGSTENALIHAGITPRKPGTNIVHRAKTKNVSGRYTDEFLIQMIRDFRKTNGREPSRSDLRRNILPSENTYKWHFGTWKKALKLAKR